MARGSGCVVFGIDHALDLRDGCYLVERGESVENLELAVTEQVPHAGGEGGGAELVKRRPAERQPTDFRVHDHHLVNAAAATIAGVPALRTPDRLVDRLALEFFGLE